MNASNDDYVVFDFTIGGSPSDLVWERYYAVASEIREEYVIYIGGLYSKEKNKLDWWLESIASRNPVYGDFFHNIVCLVALDELLKSQKKPKKVKVSCRSMANSVKQICDSYLVYPKIEKPPLQKRVLQFLRNKISPFRSILKLFLNWLIIRSSGVIHRKEGAKNLILIDTFTIPGFVKKDRYYPGLYDQLGSNKSAIRFVPQFLNFSLLSLRKAVLSIRERNKQYLLKEDYLSFVDMIWCFGHITRRNVELPRETSFRGIVVDDLLLAEHKKMRGFRSALYGLMNYRFARSLRNAEISLNKTIDWFENNPLDRGWNAGFNMFYSDITRIGYTGFFPAGQSFRPSKAEFEAGILPQSHLIIGEGFREEFCEFYKDCKLNIGPALRYKTLPNIGKREKEEFVVLVAMPYYVATCESIIEIVLELQKEQPRWKFVIKLHPARSLMTSNRMQLLLSRNAELTECSIDSWLDQASLMITGAQASTILESAACGVPTVLMFSKNFLGEISIPKVIAKDLYRLCNDIEDVRAFLKELVNESDMQIDARVKAAYVVRNQCFSQVNDESLDRLIEGS